MTPGPVRSPRRAAASGSSPSVLGRGDLGQSLLLIFPLFLLYEVGVVFSPTVNGVDFVTRWVFAAVGHDRKNYLLCHLGLAVAFLVLVLAMRRRRVLSFRVFLPMLLESAIYALTLGTFIIFVMEKLLGFGGDLALGENGQHLVMSLGAGVHEELVFRLGLVSGAAAILGACKLRHALAVTLAMVASSLLFSAVHHFGPYGDDWQLAVFTYRALAGVLFAVVFYFRSLAHAVYTHFLYDVYVLMLQ
jgi:hypothetical protein